MNLRLLAPCAWGNRGAAARRLERNPNEGSATMVDARRVLPFRDAALKSELSKYETPEGIVMASSSWKISARNPD